MIKQPFSKLGERASDLLCLIHINVCGPMSTPVRHGYRYFITFTDVDMIMSTLCRTNLNLLRNSKSFSVKLKINME